MIALMISWLIDWLIRIYLLSRHAFSRRTEIYIPHYKHCHGLFCFLWKGLISQSSLLYTFDPIFLSSTKMGGEISITNRTRVPLVMSLWQISPLYYDNFVPSGGTFHRRTGMVHLSIRARIWNGENGYTDWDNYLPIGALLLGGLTLGAGALAAGGVALGMVGLAATQVPAWIAGAAAASAEVYAIGQTLVVISGLFEWSIRWLIDSSTKLFDFSSWTVDWLIDLCIQSYLCIVQLDWLVDCALLTCRKTH